MPKTKVVRINYQLWDVVNLRAGEMPGITTNHLINQLLYDALNAPKTAGVASSAYQKPVPRAEKKKNELLNVPVHNRLIIYNDDEDCVDVLWDTVVGPDVFLEKVREQARAAVKSGHGLEWVRMWQNKLITTYSEIKEEGEETDYETALSFFISVYTKWKDMMENPPDNLNPDNPIPKHGLWDKPWKALGKSAKKGSYYIKESDL